MSLINEVRELASVEDIKTYVYTCNDCDFEFLTTEPLDLNTDVLCPICGEAKLVENLMDEDYDNVTTSLDDEINLEELPDLEDEDE